jgi:hypothetical protein
MVKDAVTDYSHLPAIDADYEVPKDSTDLFLVPAARMPYLQDRIKKLQSRQKRLAKQGPLADASPITLDVTARQTRPPLCLYCRRPHDGNHAPAGKNGVEDCLHGRHGGFWKPGPPRIYFLCRVDGPQAKLADWEFIATLQHEEAGTILRSVPGAEIAEGELDRFRDVKPHCEHCKVRRFRKDSYVVRHENGETRQIGRNCLGKYLGGVNPKHIARLAEFLIEARAAGDEEPEMGWGVGGPVEAPIDELLLYVATHIRLHGWLSRGKAREEDALATVDEAWALLFPWSPKMHKLSAEFVAEITDQDAELARAALTCARTELTAENTRNDYEHNLRIACTPDTVTTRTAGIAASVICWYERRLAREIKRREARKRAADLARSSAHIGNVGDMVNVVVTVSGIYDGESDWGEYFFHRFIDDNGNCIVWRSTAKRLEVGATYELRGKIKEHGEFKGTKQTQLTRCRVIEKRAQAR